MWGGTKCRGKAACGSSTLDHGGMQPGMQMSATNWNAHPWSLPVQSTVVASHAAPMHFTVVGVGFNPAGQVTVHVVGGLPLTGAV